MSTIIHKRVTMLELFYDLVFVYAISKITGMVHHLHHGSIDWITFVQFIAVCLFMDQIWVHQTAYVNKYGTSTVTDCIGLALNMFGAVYVSNSINTTWETTFYPFNIGMMAMVISLALQYYFHGRCTGTFTPEIKELILRCIAEVIMIGVGLALGYQIGIWIVIVTYIIVSLLPVRNWTIENTNLPHLVERVSLLTIILFGEMIVTITQFFDITQFGVLPVITFIGSVTLFGTYVFQIEEMIDLHRQEKGFLLIYAHFISFIALEMITASWGFLEQQPDPFFLWWFMFGGLVTFYLSLFALTYYHKAAKKLPTSLVVQLGGLILVAAGIAYFVASDPILFAAVVALLNSVILLKIWLFNRKHH